MKEILMNKNQLIVFMSKIFYVLARSSQDGRFINKKKAVRKDQNKKQ